MLIGAGRLVPSKPSRDYRSKNRNKERFKLEPPPISSFTYPVSKEEARVFRLRQTILNPTATERLFNSIFNV